MLTPIQLIRLCQVQLTRHFNPADRTTQGRLKKMGNDFETFN